jgi:hypothetical protein
MPRAWPVAAVQNGAAQASETMMLPTKKKLLSAVHLLRQNEPKRDDIHQPWVAVADPLRCSEAPTSLPPLTVHPHHISGTNSEVGHCG